MRALIFGMMILLGGACFAAEGITVTRAGNAVTITITVDATEILASAATAKEKKAALLAKARRILSTAEEMRTAAELDAAAAAEKAAIDKRLIEAKAMRPAGEL